MRILLAVVLLAFLAAIGVFAMENTAAVTIRFLNYRLTSSLALMAVAIYLLGMVSGWTVIGFLRRSVRRVSEHEDARSR